MGEHSGATTNPTRLFSDESNLWLLFEGSFYVFPFDELTKWTQKQVAQTQEETEDSSEIQQTIPTFLDLSSSLFRRVHIHPTIDMPQKSTHALELVHSKDTHILWDQTTAQLRMFREGDGVPMFRPCDTQPRVRLPLSRSKPTCHMSCAVSKNWIACVDLAGKLHIHNRQRGVWERHDVWERYDMRGMAGKVTYVHFWRDDILLVMFGAALRSDWWTWSFGAYRLDERVPQQPQILLAEMGEIQYMATLPNVGVLAIESSRASPHAHFFPARYLDGIKCNEVPDFPIESSGLVWAIVTDATQFWDMCITPDGRYIVAFWDALEESPAIALDFAFAGGDLRRGKRILEPIITRDLALFLEEPLEGSEISMTLMPLAPTENRWLLDVLLQFQMYSSVFILPNVHLHCAVTLLCLYVLFHTLENLTPEKIQALGWHLRWTLSRWNLFFAHRLDYPFYVTKIAEMGHPFHTLPIIAQALWDAKTSLHAYMNSMPSPSLLPFCKSLTASLVRAPKETITYFTTTPEPRSQGLIDGKIRYIYVCNLDNPVTVLLTDTHVWTLRAPNEIATHKLAVSSACHDEQGVFLLSTSGLLWELNLSNLRETPRPHITAYTLQNREGFHGCSANSDTTKRGVVALSNYNVYFWQPSYPQKMWIALNGTAPENFQRPVEYDPPTVDDQGMPLCVWRRDHCYFTSDALRRNKLIMDHYSDSDAQKLLVYDTRNLETTTRRSIESVDVRVHRSALYIRDMRIKQLTVERSAESSNRLLVLLAKDLELVIACYVFLKHNKLTLESHIKCYYNRGLRHTIMLPTMVQNQVHWDSACPCLLLCAKDKNAEYEIVKVWPSANGVGGSETLTTFTASALAVVPTPVYSQVRGLQGSWHLPLAFQPNSRQYEQHGFGKYGGDGGPCHVTYMSFSAVQDVEPHQRPTETAASGPSNGGGTEPEKTEEAIGETGKTMGKTAKEAEEEVRRVMAEIRARKAAEEKVVPRAPLEGPAPQHRPPRDRHRMGNDGRPPPKTKKDGPHPPPTPGEVTSLEELFGYGLGVPREGPLGSLRSQQHVDELIQRRFEEDMMTHTFRSQTPKEPTKALTTAFCGDNAYRRPQTGLAQSHRTLTRQTEQDQFENGDYFRGLCNFIHAIYVRYKETRYPNGAPASFSPRNLDFETSFDHLHLPYHKLPPVDEPAPLRDEQIKLPDGSMRTFRQEWVDAEWNRNDEMMAIAVIAKSIWLSLEMSPAYLMQLLSAEIESE